MAVHSAFAPYRLPAGALPREASRTALAAGAEPLVVRIDEPLPGGMAGEALADVVAGHAGAPEEACRAADGSLSGALTLPADEIDNNGGKGDLKFVVNSSEALAQTLKEKSDRWSQTVYIFATPDIKYPALLDFIRPPMKTHPGVYVFLDKQ